ncbi:hypothetical protein [Achromobacter ruhlandii]|uniref:hypothetical protein n=1 Tax=Achromobacter ruhlandii TaxID=72557 RepID=UPI000C256364|nr:hypothetical protein [Achromobacter ruhlandii]PJM72073.1 hypothetical protein CV751_03265 [Achromobacter ruhlandii]
MTNQNNAAQPVLTDDEIEALAKKHIAPHADRLDEIMPHRVPYRQTEQFRRVKALIGDVLSKLRAPASSIREAFELTYAADADDPACATELSHFTNGWRACVMSQVRTPVADERAALDPLDPSDDYGAPVPNVTELGDLLKEKGVTPGAAHQIAKAIHMAGWCGKLLPMDSSVLASAPVAGEARAVDDGSDSWDGARKRVPKPAAAPQASAESVDLPGIDADRLRTIAASGSQTAMANALLNVARALKQPQAAKDARPCSCPGSGDGSLRHPCAVHPPKDNQ